MPQWKKSHAKIPLAWARRTWPWVGPERRGDGSNSGVFKDCPDRGGADLAAHPAGSPAMRRYPSQDCRWRDAESPCAAMVTWAGGSLALGGPSLCD